MSVVRKLFEDKLESRCVCVCVCGGGGGGGGGAERLISYIWHSTDVCAE